MRSLGSIITGVGLCCFRCSCICGREGDEDIAGAIARGAAGTCDAHGRAARKPLQLMRSQRRVGCDHDDDRSVVRVAAPACATGYFIASYSRPTGTPPTINLVAASEVSLHKRTDSVSAGSRKLARCCSYSAFESEKTMPVPPPTLPSGTGPC